MDQIPAYNPDQDTFGTIPAVESEQPTVPSAPIIEDRSKKANFGLQGKIRETYTEIKQSIADGNEQLLRDSAARQIEYQNILKRNEAISKVAAGLDRPLTPNDLADVERKIAQPTNPDSIFEDHFALQYMGYIDHDKNNPDSTSWVKQVQKEWPNEFDAYRQLGIHSIATTELLRTRLENVSSNIEDESVLRRVFNFAKQQIPGYPEYNLSRLVAGASVHFGLGSSLEDQSLNFYRMSRQDQIATLDRVHESFKNNPEMEATFLSGLIGQSSSEKMQNDLSLPLNALMLEGLGKPVKGLLYKQFPALAVRDYMKGMKNSIGDLTPEITGPAAVGDLGKAAVNRAAEEVLSKMSGNDPRRREIEEFVDFWKGKREDFQENPGNYAAALTSQMVEHYEAVPDLILSELMGMMRNENVPELRAMQTIWDKFKEHVADYLPSVDNKILNISFPKKDPLTGAWHVDVNLGNQFGKYFADDGSARAYANIHRIPDFDIVGSPLTFEDQIARLEAEPQELHKPRTITELEKKPVLKETSTPGKYKIVQEPITRELPPIPEAPDTGSGYYIKISMPLDTTHPFIRGMIEDGIKTNAFGTKTPESLFTRFLGGILSPEHTMSVYARTQRAIATFGPNVLTGIADEMGKDIGKLAKGAHPFTAKRQKWSDLQRVMEYGRNLPDPKNPDGVPGYTFRNPGELEYAFRKVVGYSPDEQQIKAYFAWKQLGELDWTLRNLSSLKDMLRTGNMDTAIYTVGPDGKRAYSNRFPAALQNSIPTRGMVLIMGDKLGDEEVKTARALAPDTEMGKRLRSKSPTEKLQIVKLYDRFARPLEGWGNVKDEPISYIVGKFDRKNLGFKQLPERGGGHFIYDYPFYLKQGIINRELISEAETDENGVETKAAKYNHNYEGDKTLLAIRTRAEGKEIERRFNSFRELIRDDKIEEAKQFLRDNPLPYDFEDLIKKFKPLPRRNSRTGRMMAAKPEIDLNEPIRLMDANKNIGDAFGNEYRAKYGRGFVNQLRGDNPASQHRIAFTGERDVRQLMSIVDEGGRGNPVFKLQPAQMIDPMTAMNRGIRNISNSFFFDDLKIGFMEHWLQEAKEFMDLRPGQLQNSGFSLFHNPRWVKNPNADTLDRIKQLEVVRKQHLSLVSRPGEQESYLMSVAQHLTDAMYTKLGPKYTVQPLSVYAMMRDGPAYLRGMAAHFKLGNFNPSQFLKQLNGWANIYGIEGPVKASQGMAAALMHELTRINDNPEVIAHMEKILGNFGWKLGEFPEYRDFMSSTGFDTVGGEYAARDSIWSGKVYSNGVNRFLSLGMSFFTEGERAVRYGAMATAYRKFRDLHPTGPLSDADKEVILQRARLLNANMDRAASSIWQHGIGSIPLQFQTYAMRLADLMFGKQLTGIEKARMIATYFTLYGFPVTATLSGLPIADNLRKLAMDNTKYTVGDGYISNTLMEGVPAVLGNIISGHTYNIGQAYGPSGIGNISPTLRSDQTMWQIILESSLGPSGSILANTWSNTDGLRRWGMNIFNDEFPFQWEDVVRSWKEIAIIRRGDQTRQALQSGNWYSTRGEKLATDIDPMDAIWMFLSGLDHQQVGDGFLVGKLDSDRKEYNQYTEKIFTENWRAGIRMAQDGPGYNPNQADEYFIRAATILKARGYPIEDYAQLFARATRDYETLAEKMNKEYNMRHVPAGYEEYYMQRQLRRLQAGSKQ